MNHAMYVFEAIEGEGAPPGEYLVTLWESGEVELAYRPRPEATWGRPLRGEVR